MIYIASILKWCTENPGTLRYGLLALGVAVIIGWVYHKGSANVSRQEEIKGLETAANVKEQYDEISNRRPDDNGVLGLLRAGAF